MLIWVDSTLVDLSCVFDAHLNVLGINTLAIYCRSFAFQPTPLLTLTLSTQKIFFNFGEPKILYAICSCVWISIRILAHTGFGSYFDSGASRVTYACKNKHYFETLRSSRLHLWAEKFWKTRARFARRLLRSLASFPKIYSAHKLGARLATS